MGIRDLAPSSLNGYSPFAQTPGHRGSGNREDGPVWVMRCFVDEKGGCGVGRMGGMTARGGREKAVGGCWGLPRDKDQTPPFHGTPLQPAEGAAPPRQTHPAMCAARAWGPGQRAVVNTGNRPRINQGAPGLRDISGRAWHMQNGQRRGWQDSWTGGWDMA